MSEPLLFGNSSLPDELDARVRSELDHSEHLLWVGQPQPSRFARKALPLVLFAIPWTAFAVFWMVMASVGVLQNAGPGIGGFDVCFPLFGIPFVLVGLGMLSSPFWLRRNAKRTCYALTNRRAILWAAGFFGSVEVRSYRPAALTKIVRRDYPNGSGDLVFEETITMPGTRYRDTFASTQGHGFMGIDNVREIEELLRKALLSDSGL